MFFFNIIIFYDGYIGTWIVKSGILKSAHRWYDLTLGMGSYKNITTAVDNEKILKDYFFFNILNVTSAFKNSYHQKLLIVFIF